MAGRNHCGTPIVLEIINPTNNAQNAHSKYLFKVYSALINRTTNAITNKTTGTTVIMATHDRDIVNKLKKRVLVLKDGYLIKDYEKGKYYDEAN